MCVEHQIDAQRVIVEHTPLLAVVHGDLSDFRMYVTQPYILITMLRNPLELAVSALQFKHRNQTRTLEEATSFVEGRMRDRLT